MLKIHSNENIKCLLMEERNLELIHHILKNPKVFIDYSQTIDDFNKHLEGGSPIKKRSVLIVFDDMIADMKYKKNQVLLLLNCF